MAATAPGGQEMATVLLGLMTTFMSHPRVNVVRVLRRLLRGRLGGDRYTSIIFGWGSWQALLEEDAW